MTVIPADFAQANWKFGGVAAPHGAEVTLGLYVGTYVGTPADAAQDCIDAWVDNVSAGQVSDIELQSVLVKFGPNDTGPSAEIAGGTPGGVGSNALTPQVAILVQKITALGGRAGRGRFFVPGAAEALFGGEGDMAPGDPAIYDGFFAAFQADLEADLLYPVVLHGETSPLSVPTPITSFATQATAATQRRRIRP